MSSENLKQARLSQLQAEYELLSDKLHHLRKEMCCFENVILEARYVIREETHHARTCAVFRNHAPNVCRT